MKNSPRIAVSAVEMNLRLNTILLVLLFLTGCATEWKASYTADSAQQLLDVARKNMPTVELADARQLAALAGQYSTGHGLALDEIFLFPDGTYAL